MAEQLNNYFCLSSLVKTEPSPRNTWGSTGREELKGIHISPEMVLDKLGTEGR